MPRHRYISSRVFQLAALWQLLPPLAAATGAAESVTTIRILPGSHLDIGFTDTPAAVRETRIRILDDAIEAAKADPAFHWHEESGWVVDAWRSRHAGDPERIAELSGLLKAGGLSLGASWCNPHAALFPESLDLLTFHLDDFERGFGVRPTVAVLNDVPSYPEALVDSLAARGVRHVLIGANLSFSPPLPSYLAKTPFWWESAGGARVLVYIDDDAYTAAYTKWGVDPDSARFFGPKDFPRDRGPRETMEAGISRMLKSLFVVSPGRQPVGIPERSTATPEDIIVQHAFDNWDTTGAKKLPGFVKMWNNALDQPWSDAQNDAGRKPRLIVGGPEGYFRRIEEKYGKSLPVRRGEWGGQWEVVRASSPVWTWRLRRALAALRKDATFETKAALATAMEHSQGLGPGWPRYFTEEQTVAHNREVAALLERAVAAVLGPTGAEAAPGFEDTRRGEGISNDLPAGLRTVLAERPIRLRAGRSWLAPFVVAEASELKTEISLLRAKGGGAAGEACSVRFRVDRKNLAGCTEGTVAVVVEIPLRGGLKALSIAPVDSPAAVAGRWLCGAPPETVIAPNGLRVAGLARPLLVTSPIVFAWTLVADRSETSIAWLQGLVASQSCRCELKGGEVKALPYAQLYPGEPAELCVEARLELKDR